MILQGFRPRFWASLIFLFFACTKAQRALSLLSLQFPVLLCICLDFSLLALNVKHLFSDQANGVFFLN